MGRQNTNKIVLYNKTFLIDDPNINHVIKDGFCFSTDPRYVEDAAALIFHIPTLEQGDRMLKTGVKKKGQVWAFWSQECEVHYTWEYTPEVLALFDVFATYKLDSTISQPYFYFRYLEEFRAPPVSKTAFVNAFISHAFDKSNRVNYLRELMKYIDVDCYGKLFKNKQIIDDAGVSSKLEIISRYKFSIAFENAIAKDYVTEKFFQPLAMGSVPVYLGAPNIGIFAPGQHCYIDVRSFSGPRELAEYLIELNGDDTRYMEYLKWKEQPYNEQFEAMCKARKNGLYELVDYIKDKRGGLI